MFPVLLPCKNRDSGILKQLQQGRIAALTGINGVLPQAQVRVCISPFACTGRWKRPIGNAMQGKGRDVYIPMLRHSIDFAYLLARGGDMSKSP